MFLKNWENNSEINQYLQNYLPECVQNDPRDRCLLLTQMLFDQIVLFSNLNVDQLTLGQFTLGQHNVAKSMDNKSKTLSQFLSQYSFLLNSITFTLILTFCLLLQPILNTPLALFLNFKVPAAKKAKISWGETYAYIKCEAHSKHSPHSKNTY